MSNEYPEGEDVVEYLRTVADAIEDGTFRVSHAVVKPNIRQIKHAHDIQIDREYIGDSVTVEVSTIDAVIGDVTKTIEKSDVEMDSYEEFWAKSGETYKIVKSDD